MRVDFLLQMREDILPLTNGGRDSSSFKDLWAQSSEDREPWTAQESLISSGASNQSYKALKHGRTHGNLFPKSFKLGQLKAKESLV